MGSQSNNFPDILYVSHFTDLLIFQQGYSIASDIWSLGITAIEMGERQPPYAETHPSRVMVAIPARPPPEFLNPDAWSKSLKVGTLQRT